PAWAAERRQIERLEQRMVPGAIPVRRHPHDLSLVQIDGGDAAVWRLEQRKPLGPGRPGTRAGHIVQIRDLRVALDDIGGEGTRDRLHVEHAGFRIEGAALPVRSSDRTGQLDRSADAVGTLASYGRRREHGTDAVVLQERDSFGA